MRIKKSIVNIGKLPYYVIEFNYNTPKDEKIVNINCEGKVILYLTRGIISFKKDTLSTILSKSINKFYIISSQDEEFEFKINEETYKSSNVKSSLTPLDIKSLLYSMAYDEYNKGNSIETLEILKISLRDKYLTRFVLNAFTAKEREKCNEILLKAVHNRKIKIQPRFWIKARFIEGIMGDNELVDKGHCFMELLEVFERNGDRFIPQPSEIYKRIGKKIVDNYNAFKSDKAVQLAADFRDLIFSKEKLNISIRYEIPGYVTINPRQARAVGFNTNVFSAKIFREQTIIKDGDINIDKFCALVSKDTLKYLSGLNVKGLFRVVDTNYYVNKNYAYIEVNISQIPVVSRNYVLKYDNLDYILETYYEQRIAECKQKVTKYFIERCCKNTKGIGDGHTKEQYDLLYSYGLDSNGVYHGIDNKILNEDKEQYECRFFEFALKGFSTLSKVDNLLTRMRDSKKKLNKPDSIMADYIKYLIQNKLTNNRNELDKLLQEQKIVIRRNTRILAQVKLVKIMTGGWWKELKSGINDSYFYEKGDRTLVIKAMRKMIQT